MKKIISVLIVIGLLFPNIVFAQTSTKAYLTIKVNVSGVTITIDGKSYGETSPDEPILEEFNSGNYKITASKYGYKTDTKNIILQPYESREIIFELALPEAFEIDKDKDKGIIGVEYGSLTIVVRKGGKLVPAKVYIDDSFADNAPTTINKLYVGKHDIKVSYKQDEKFKTININKNEKRALDIELLNFGSLSVSTTVDGESVKAKIYLDGEFVNTTPHEINTISEGQHKVKLTYQKHTETQYVEIYPDTEKKLNIDFNPKSEIHLTSSISGIKYNIDFKKRGFVPDIVKLKSNNYNFKFTKDGLVPANRTLGINEYKNYDIIVNLDNKLPNVTIDMIGERYRTEEYTSNDFLKKPEYHKEMYPFFALLSGFSFCAMIIGAIVLPRDENDEYTDGGYTFLYSCSAGLISPMLIGPIFHTKTPIKKNITYNKNIPNLIGEKNNEVKLYNQNIDDQLKKEQLRRYNEDAIKVYEK